MPDKVIETEQSDIAAAEACQKAGLKTDGGLRLIRRGTNAVYRLSAAHAIVRVAPPGIDPVAVRRQIDVARWLQDENISAIRVIDIAQPIEAHNRWVTIWEAISDGDADDHDQYGSTRELGQVLKQLHASPPPVTDLPRFEPLKTLAARLDQVGPVVERDRLLIDSRVEILSAAYRQLDYSLSPGPIHGDANVGNLLRDRSGTAVLSDLDNFSTGHREWDLVQTAMFAELYGWHSAEEYAQFVDAYGYDIRQWQGYSVIRDIRELTMVLWLAGSAKDSPPAMEELQKRLESLRTGKGRSDWQPL